MLTNRVLLLFMTGRILMQKLARDQVRALSQYKSVEQIPPTWKDEVKFAMILQQGGKDKWDENFRTVYGLANAVQKRVLKEWTGKEIQQRVSSSML